MIDPLLVIAAAYLIGSIPFAFLLARRRGIDLRTVGSGNVGASNALRTSGVTTGLLVMALDGLKGAIAVILAERVATGGAVAVAAGLASIAGHIYPVWLRFRGGKGVATAAGAFGMLAPAALAAAVLVFVFVVSITRFISMGSITAALTLAVATALTDSSFVVIAGAVIAAAMIIYRHHGNVMRLMAGTERRMGGA